MTRVLAATRPQANSEAVLSMAAAIAELIGSEVRQLELPKGLPARTSAQRILHELREPATVLAVVAADADPHGTCWAVLEQAAKPVILVPHNAPAALRAIERVLLPLDGSTDSAAAVARASALFADTGVDLIVLHVFDAMTVPRFWDQPAHAMPVFTQEFLARNVGTTRARLEVRTGVPGKNVVDVAAAENVNLIGMAWAQSLAPGRAATVRHCLDCCNIPIMLLPLLASAAPASPPETGLSPLPALPL